MRIVNAGGSETSLRAVLLQADMLRLFLASLFILSQVLVSFSLVPLYILERGGDMATVGLHTTIFAVASVVLRFFLGPLADTRGRRFALALGAFAFSTANVFILLSPNLFVMALVRVYQAVGMAAYLSSASSLVADLAPREQRGSAIGAYRVIMPAASLFGPFLGNELINRYGYPVFFLVMAAAAALSFLLVLSLKSGRRDPGAVPLRITPVDVLRLFGNPRLRAAYAAILGISIGGGIVTTFAAAYGAPWFTNSAVYFLAYAVAGAVSALVLGRLSDTLGRSRMIMPIFFSMALGLALLQGIPVAPWFVFLTSAVLTGIGFNAGLSVCIAWIVDSVHQDLRATALSLQESWIDGGFAVGIFFFGLFSARYGMAPSFLGTGAFLLAGSFLVLALAGRASEPRAREGAVEQLSREAHHDRSS